MVLGYLGDPCFASQYRCGWLQAQRLRRCLATASMQASCDPRTCNSPRDRIPHPERAPKSSGLPCDGLRVGFQHRSCGTSPRQKVQSRIKLLRWKRGDRRQRHRQMGGCSHRVFHFYKSTSYMSEHPLSPPRYICMFWRFMCRCEAEGGLSCTPAGALFLGGWTEG